MYAAHTLPRHTPKQAPLMTAPAPWPLAVCRRRIRGRGRDVQLTVALGWVTLLLWQGSFRRHAWKPPEWLRIANMVIIN